MSALAYESSPAEVDRTLADVLSQFALPLGYDDIPATVRERAKHLILDSVGIALASTKYPFASVSLAALEELGTGTSAVIGVGRRLSLRDAVLMNGILVHGLDFDDHTILHNQVDPITGVQGDSLVDERNLTLCDC
jgi:2-methylcitrate dehydratase PrpD